MSDITQLLETITDLRNEVATLKNDARSQRQIHAGHAMYHGGLNAKLRAELATLRRGVISESKDFRDGWKAAIDAVSNVLKP